MQTTVTIDINDLPINYALLQLVSSSTFSQSEKSQTQLKLRSNIKIPTEDFHLYIKALKHIEDIALYLKPFSSGKLPTFSLNLFGIDCYQFVF